jgi:hypothetical protein
MADEKLMMGRPSGARSLGRNMVRRRRRKRVAIIDNKGWEEDRESRINWHSAMTDST